VSNFDWDLVDVGTLRTPEAEVETVLTVGV
jgi:hypothetical protein